MVSPQHLRRKDLLVRLPKQGVGCEVGVWRGDFSAELLEVSDARELHLVDPWLSHPELTEEWFSIPQDEMDDVYQSVVDRFEDEPRVHVHRLSSPDAADEFPDGFFDWVYVDGNHTYEAVKADLEAWWPKLKPGGLLCGDDYEPGHWWGDSVIRAVDEFAANLEVFRDQFIIR